MTVYYNTEKHRLLKNSSDELVIRKYSGTINMWDHTTVLIFYNF